MRSRLALVGLASALAFSQIASVDALSSNDGATIVGVVWREGAGLPVANVTIEVFSESTGTIAATALTDAEGNYTTSPGLPTGTYRVRARVLFESDLMGEVYENIPCTVASCEVWTGTPVEATAPDTAFIVFALPVGPTITGTVTNSSTGAPVAGASVWDYNNLGQPIFFASTNAQGVYSTKALPRGFYFVTALPPSGSGLTGQLHSNLPCPGGACSVTSGTAVTLTTPEPTTIDFALAPGGTITGTLTKAASSTPAATVSVEFYTSAGLSIGDVYTDANGFYTSPWLPTGSYYVQANPTGSEGLLGQMYDSVPCYAKSCSVLTGTPVAVTAPGVTSNINISLVEAPLAPNDAFADAVVIDSIPFQSIVNVHDATIDAEDPVVSCGNQFLQASVWYVFTPTVTGLVEVNTFGSTYETALAIYTGAPGNFTQVGCDHGNDNGWPFRSALTVHGVAGQRLAILVASSSGPGGALVLNVKRRWPLVYLNDDSTGDVFLHHAATGSYSRQVSQADGSFEAAPGGFGPGANSVVPAIFDSDALTDFFVLTVFNGNWEKWRTTSAGITVQAAGTWWPGWERHVMDLDGDGLSDLFLYDPPTGAWFKCLSTPTGFAYAQGFWSPGWEIYPMRLNDDAFGDMFLINRSTGRWSWALGAENGFTYPVTETWFPGWRLYPGDFNGDGLSDLLLHDPETGVYFVALTTGSGFTYQQGAWSMGWTPHVTDLDADGKDDLFLHDPSTGVWFQMISDGAGHFTSVGSGAWSLGWTLHPTDFNGDGRADLLLYHPETGVWYQARNLVNGAFTYTSGTWMPGLSVFTRTPIR